MCEKKQKELSLKDLEGKKTEDHVSKNENNKNKIKIMNELFVQKELNISEKACYISYAVTHQESKDFVQNIFVPDLLSLGLNPICHYTTSSGQLRMSVQERISEVKLVFVIVSNDLQHEDFCYRNRVDSMKDDGGWSCGYEMFHLKERLKHGDTEFMLVPVFLPGMTNEIEELLPASLTGYLPSSLSFSNQEHYKEDLLGVIGKYIVSTKCLRLTTK